MEATSRRTNSLNLLRPPLEVEDSTKEEDKGRKAKDHFLAVDRTLNKPTYSSSLLEVDSLKTSSQVQQIFLEI